MSDDQFHQIVSVLVHFGKLHSPGEVNRIFKTLGAKLHYDVYGFDRLEKGPVWQSESYAYITLFRDQNEVDAQDSSDSVELQYPLATIGSEYIEKFADLAVRVAEAFNTQPKINGETVDRQSIISLCEDLASDLMSEWGEEPGSRTLRILIESNYR